MDSRGSRPGTLAPVVNVMETPQKITGMTFGLLSGHDMTQISEVQVVNRELYKLPERIPMPFGCLDSRMGPNEKNGTCETCGQKFVDCIGHFGHIKLELPVYHVGYMKATITTLNCICKRCARILLPEADRQTFLRRMRSPRLDSHARGNLLKKIIEKAKKNPNCPHCGYMNGLVKRIPNSMKLIQERYKTTTAKKEELTKSFKETFEEAMKYNKDIITHLNKAQEDLNPLEVLQLFKRIMSEDVELLDMDPKIGRPERMIFTHIPVPPTCIRPTVPVDNGGTNEDDITMKLHDIVGMNNMIKLSIEKGTHLMQLMEQWEYVQLQCALLINADAPSIQPGPHKGKTARTFVQRLKGKGGRFRGNLSGKRVDFTSRTVISPDPNLRVDEVALPVHVAKIVTYPERVNDANIERLRQNVINGPDVHPGANFIELVDGFKRFLKFGDRNKMAADLKVGDIVERHIIDGDLVLFNRQPSLHKVSIMCHKVRVMPWRTFRFNECACTPYNADFDGDEMNVHVPQTEEARAEAAELMALAQNLITPRSGEPLVAATQDFLSTAYLITRRDVFYDRSQFVQILMGAFDGNEHLELPPPAILKPVQLWTGKQIFGVMLKPNKHSKVNINLEIKLKTFTNPKGMDPSMCSREGWVVYRNSELLCGVMDKVGLGGSSKANIFHAILRDNGCDEAVTSMTRLSKLSARFLGNRGFSIGISDVRPSDTVLARKQQLLDEGYKKCDDMIAQWREGRLEPVPGCNMEQSIELKLNGELSQLRDKAGEICLQELPYMNTPLIMSICGSKGSTLNISQMVACVGQQTVANHRIPEGFLHRTTPHFELFSKYPEAKGFVKNSFYSGLSPTEFFFHTMGGREGLVDTAVKTAETGYMQRRLVKALEDLSVQYDNTVRDSMSGIVQFTYGEDGLDPTGMEAVGKPVDFSRILAQVTATNPHKNEESLLPGDIMHILKGILESKDYVDCSDVFKSSLREFFTSFCQNLIAKREMFGLPTTMETTLESEKANPPKSIYENPSQAYRAIDQLKRLTRSHLVEFMRICNQKYKRAEIEPGTAVGAVTAQSIGEPGTQMTLKTFHFAGIASMNVSQGVPRIKEIINASKTVATPIIKAKLVTDNDKKVARIVKGRMEKTTLGQVAEYIKEVLSPEGSFVLVKLDMQTISSLMIDLTIEQVRWALLREKGLKLKEKNIVITSRDKLKVYPSDASGDKIFFQVQRLKIGVGKVIVTGIEKVTRAIITEPKSNKFEMVLEGMDLLSVLGTPGINARETTSNHIIEVAKVLGIEAARTTIMEEIGDVMRAYGMSIDPRHLMLLSDVMTYRGEVLGITRFGISKMKESVLMLASFERTTDILFDASVHSRHDVIRGISECIILGRPIPIGTGCIKVLRPTQISQPLKRTPLLDYANNAVATQQM
eukprot:TRINITY_DN6142_c0_g1_i1.p1 TRINITY_DN6142_c0_g1~~TRINITY_DN6142_c0_g1_i1.p1  ORF type:complete len:1415 (-),score=417.97 TRINITY_DN6142_c0_g1_i1:165-4409(-)